MARLLAFASLLLVAFVAQQCRAAPLTTKSEETTAVATVNGTSTTEIDTLGENTRVKRQGGCGCCGCGGCGCGCGCCQPCCCCCKPCCCCCQKCCQCCTCCKTCCCTCCKPCCCGCGCGCGGCGCCGCGGGRKRRSLQNLRIKAANKFNLPALPTFTAPAQPEEAPETIPAIPEVIAPEVVAPEGPVSETVVDTTEWPAPVFELVTETSA